MAFTRLFCLLATVSVVAMACGSDAGPPPNSDGATDQAIAATGSGGSGGSGGSLTTADGGLAAGGNGGDPYCATLVSAPAVDAGPACPVDLALGWDCGESYVDVVGDGDPIRLAYPMDPSCGTCDATGCRIWGEDFICCGPGRLMFAACAGPDGAGPCLDAHACDRYVDRDGKTWLATITPDALNSEAPLDLQATVTITDGTTTRSLSVHIHICGHTNYCGVIC